MAQALYRKHRSKSLDQIVGQEHITGTLKKALKADRISHAYLFTGPRGVGKTSIARIWAHEINHLPYEDDSSHMDIIEIDAASNRRIDEIRELRDKVYVAPTSLKYKVYIIDEVHMLTREAFNALLKTLEEPPAHVVFILATTDAHKLPETIISRTQRFSFKPAESATVTELLRGIAKTEKIAVSDAALALIAEHSGGSFRDSVSLLDQASSQSEQIEAGDVQRLLGIPPREAVQALADQLNSAHGTEVIKSLTELYDQGYQAATIAKQLARNLRQQIITDGSNKASILRLLADLIEVPVSHDPERFLEIILLKATHKTVSSGGVKASVTPDIELVVEAADAVPAQPAVVIPPISEEPVSEAKVTAVLDTAIWPNVLQALKQRHNTLYGVIRMAQPDFSEEGKLKLTFAFDFHHKRLKENSNQQKLSSIIREITGQVVSIDCLVDKGVKLPKLTVPAVTQSEPVQKPSDDKSLTAISNIFGKAELLES